LRTRVARSCAALMRLPNALEVRGTAKKGYCIRGFFVTPVYADDDLVIIGTQSLPKQRAEGSLERCTPPVRRNYNTDAGPCAHKNFTGLARASRHTLQGPRGNNSGCSRVDPEDSTT
jgi:hypothetical protein